MEGNLLPPIGAQDVRATAWRTGIRLAAGDAAVELAREKGAPDYPEVCWHEAGHAVIALFQGEPVTAVVVRQDGSGYVQIGHLDPELTACYNRSDDEKQAGTNVVLRLGGDEPLDLRSIHWDASELLLEYWSAVEALAASLSSRLIGAAEAHMTGGEVRRVWEWNSNRKGE